MIRCDHHQCVVKAKNWGGTDIPVCARTDRNVCVTPKLSLGNAPNNRAQFGSGLKVEQD
jgi:hypothetical protein